MKKLVLLVLAVFCVSFAINAQTVPTTEAIEETIKKAEDGEGPSMTFDTMVVDYGVIEQHSEPLRKLKFVNTGTEPLVITNARGSCGCTVPSYAKEPIMPGEESILEIRYATNRIGKFTKKVTITTNEASGPHIITVKGEVFEKEKEEGIPASTGGL